MHSVKYLPQEILPSTHMNVMVDQTASGNKIPKLLHRYDFREKLFLNKTFKNVKERGRMKLFGR